MTLSDTDALERIVKPKNKVFLELAVFQEERLILHGESILEKYSLPFVSFNNFTRWWQSLISASKYNRIDELLNCPFFTVGIVKDIFDQLQKFIDAQDRYIEFKFVSKDYTNDYNEFLESQNDDTFWRQKVINELKTGICSYVVIDLPSEQKTDLPEPYNYFVSPKMVRDVELNRYNGKVEFIEFSQSDFYWNPELITISSDAKFNMISEGTPMEKIICIDDSSYRIFVHSKKSKSNDWILFSKSEHGLGYCPVIDFWKDSIKGTNGINKIGPITLQLSNFDYILFFKACIDYMNLYGPFPMAVTYDMNEGQWDDKNKETNTGGNWDKSRTNAISNSPNLNDPRKSGRSFIAPGGGFQVPVPADSSDHDFMKNPMKWVSMDVESVDAANKLLDKFENKIKEKCTGIDKEYMNEIAKNKEMFDASFRNEETILTWIKSNIERVHRFVTKAKCELRYGKEYFLGCVIDYGSDYLLKDATTLSDEFKKAVDNGMPQGYSFEIGKTAIITRFKNNPEKLARLSILLDLEPYPNMSWKDIKSLGIDEKDKINFIVKANFNTFVNRFELENGSIVTFGNQISYSIKIEKIKQTFKTYADELSKSWVGTSKKSGNKIGQGETSIP